MNDPLAVFAAVITALSGVGFLASSKELGKGWWLGWLFGLANLKCAATTIVALLLST